MHGQDCGARRRTELVGNTEAVSYAPGQTVKLRARLLRPELLGELSEAQVVARLDREGAKPITLRLDSDRREFHGDIPLPQVIEAMDVGVLFEATGPDGKAIGEDRVDVRILHIAREFVQITPDPDLLAQLARATGGVVVEDAAALKALLQDDEQDDEQRTNLCKVPLWDRAWLWILVMLLFSAEWLIRKLVRFA